MTTVLWLRISSVIALLFAAGHSLGGLKYWSPMGENPVLKSMRDIHFDTLGVSRSYLDFYMGFGYSLTVAQVMQAALLWQIAALARNEVANLRPMIPVIALANRAGAIIAWRFILPIPAIFALIQLACLTAAYAFEK